MEKWEYKVVSSLTPMSEKDLNKMGQEGWELVQVVVLALTSSKHFFKRRKA